MNASTPRIRCTLLELVRAIDECGTTQEESVALVRYVLEKRRARFLSVPTVRALHAAQHGADLRAEKRSLP